MLSIGRVFDSRRGIIITGIVVGVLAPILVKLGNPGNMGVCVACFTRDIAGAIGLHRAVAVQYIRPEIIGLVMGSLASALAFREFRPRAGSAPLVKLILGMLAAIGALVFLGCPWRGFLRLGGGDWNAIWGILGLTAGIGLGTVFLHRGYSLGRSRPAPVATGWLMPVLMAALLMLLILAPLFGRDAGGNPAGPIFFSTAGPGAAHAPLLISLGVGLVIGILAQRSRFCTIGAIRNLIMLRNANMFIGIVALVASAVVTNAVLGLFKPGFVGQPVAHTNALWNFGGMVLSGLAFTLAGACPGRQLILSGEGEGDAAIFSIGMLLGAAVSHNFNLASSPAGPSPFGPAAVIIGLAVTVVIGLTMREAQEAPGN